MTSKRIVVAEDEADMRRALRLILGKAGFRVTTAADGGTALKTMIELIHSGETIDLFITDIQMPGLNGLALMAALRRHDIRLPVLVITGAGNAATEASARKNHVAGYMVKPFSPEALLRAVSRALGTGGSDPPVSPVPDRPRPNQPETTAGGEKSWHQ